MPITVSQEGAESAPAAQPATDDAKAVRTVQSMVLLCFSSPLNHQAEPASEDAKKEEPPRSPSLLAKILAPFKNVEKKAKAPKSPKKEKKEEVKVRGDVVGPCFLTDMFTHLSPMPPQLRRLPRLRTLPRLMLPKLRRPPPRLPRTRESCFI